VTVEKLKTRVPRNGLQSWKGVAFVGKPGFFDSFNKSSKH